MRQLAMIGLVFAALADRASAQVLLTLDELITGAPSIVVATVESRRAEVEHYGSSRLIITRVTLRVEQTIKGSPPQRLVVEVLGGTLGGETLRVSHVPEFRVGDRDVLFLNHEPHAISPLVGSDQGRFRVLADNETGVPRVLTMGFEPLLSLSQVGAARTGVARRMSAALSLNEFVTAVRDRVRTLGVRQ